MKPIKEIHYDTEVWVSPEIEKLRRTDCLCLNCKHMGVCLLARAFYQRCKQYDIALAVTRCPGWVSHEVPSIPV